jgi:nitric oxide reductase NorQ protein
MSQIADQITTEPYYCAIEDEIDLFEAAYAEKMPMMMKGPTGCGKTRFIDNKPWF